MSQTYTPHREKDGIRKGLWDIMGPPAPPFFFLRGGGGVGGGGGLGAEAAVAFLWSMAPKVETILQSIF